MVFKLVRVDTQEPCKIQLTIGKHVIGRGKFLHNDETDKRVSRNHAELEVTSDTVNLKSLHQNPCFFIKKSIETHLLHQDTTVSLNHGDKFGLLPDHFWYEVLHCPDQDSVEERASIPQSTENGIHSDQDNGMNQAEGTTEQDNVTPNTSAAVEKEEDTINFDDGEKEVDAIRSASPSLLNAEEEAAEQTTTEPETTEQVTAETETTEQLTAGTIIVKSETVDQDTEPYESPAQQSRADNVRSPTKREHSTTECSPGDVKRVKTEHIEARDAAGPSNGQQASSGTDSKDNVAAPAPPLRERCIYGTSCYRRNPQHKAQFSHPRDVDWGDAERGECPYGRTCRRADPRHWLAHTHPPGTPQPAAHRPRPGMQVVQRHGNVYYINAHSVTFNDDNFQVEDSDGDSVDYDYEF